MVGRDAEGVTDSGVTRRVARRNRRARSPASPRRMPVDPATGSGSAAAKPDGDPISILRALVAEVLDDGYVEAAARRGGSGSSRRTPGRVSLTVAALVAAGLLFTVAAVQTQRAEPAVEQERADLISRIDAQDAHVEALQGRAEQLQADVSALQSDLLVTTSRGQELQDRVAALEVLTGTGRITGPGLTVTVDDAPESAVDPNDPAIGRILDIDLQHLVNGLWWAGAEAISINGQRLTSLTAIRGADRAITVDYRPLARPYVVEAIGDPDTLEAQFVESTGGAWFASLKKNQSIRFEMSTAEELRLPANSSARLRHSETESVP